jgi:hypothetical protein
LVLKTKKEYPFSMKEGSFFLGVSAMTFKFVWLWTDIMHQIGKTLLDYSFIS